jgi:hypothetical protein
MKTMEDVQNLANEICENGNEIAADYIKNFGVEEAFEMLSEMEQVYADMEIDQKEKDEENKNLIMYDMENIVRDLASVCYRPDSVRIFTPEMDLDLLKRAYSDLCEALGALAFVEEAVRNVMERYLVIEKKNVLAVE